MESRVTIPWKFITTIVVIIIAIFCSYYLYKLAVLARENTRKTQILNFSSEVKLIRYEYILRNIGSEPKNLNNLTYNTKNIDCKNIYYDEIIGVILDECIVGKKEQKYYYVDGRVYNSNDNLDHFKAVLELYEKNRH